MAKLLKRKHPNLDLFICDVFDATPKDLKHHLEHPMFTLSKGADMNVRIYRASNDIDYIKIIPSAFGLANIYDKDILVFAVSQLMHKINRGEKPSQTIAFSAYDLLVATNRGTGGKDYKALELAFLRLRGTQLETSFATGEYRSTKGFGIIDSWEIIREGLDGRMEGIEVKLSDWMYEGILNTEVLTLSKDYFLISSPLEKRLYELCRKHCGNQKKWDISIEKLHLKTGSKSVLRKFKYALKKICNDGNIPDYKVKLKDNMFIVTQKRPVSPLPVAFKDPSSQTMINAAKIVDGKTDVYHLLEDYKNWVSQQKDPPKKGYDAGFIGFVKKKIRDIDEHGLQLNSQLLANKALVKEYISKNPNITRNKTQAEIIEMINAGAHEVAPENEPEPTFTEMPSYISELIHEDQGDLFNK